MQRLPPRIHPAARLEDTQYTWHDGVMAGRTERSRLGTLMDKAAKTDKRRSAETTLGKVHIDNNVV